MKTRVIIGLLVFIFSVLLSIILWILGIPIFFAFLFLPLIELPVFNRKFKFEEQEPFQRQMEATFKYCPNCGYSLEGWENYCPRCGYKIN